MNESVRVFVYGSLLSGLENHGALGVSQKVADARTEEREFLMSDLGFYPGARRGGDAPLVGEVYEVSARTLARLDRLEGHPTFYRREVVETTAGPAWVYLLRGNFRRSDPRPDVVVLRGDWRTHLQARRNGAEVF